MEKKKVDLFLYREILGIMGDSQYQKPEFFLSHVSHRIWGSRAIVISSSRSQNILSVANLAIGTVTESQVYRFKYLHLFVGYPS